MPLWFRSIHAFQGGDKRSKQLSFPADALIVVPDPSQNQNGWAYGQFQNESGWFPVSYVTQTPAPAFDFSSEGDGGGFDGPIMGGTPATSYASQTAGQDGTGGTPATSYTSQTAGQDGTEPKKASPLSGVGDSFRNTGNGISNLASQTGRGICGMASRAGKGISHAASETRHRVQDMMDQKDGQQQANTHPVPPQQDVVVTSTTTPKKRSGLFGSKTTTKSTETKVSEHGTTKTITETKTKRGLFSSKTETSYRTETIPSQPTETQCSQQRDVGRDVANGAARGAVVGGVASAILGGNPVRGATRSAVYGGAHGGVRGWKPFG